eukprot:TRINITY_DN2925_c0_g5_i2.p1 TRINITY_DN2925_c0_g5~~TRINITY_DN2925_c0_g5_i2.p1  ORF type:complete len:1202 (-),score=224.82 TRINITY_DN2925_c0_g5_i2:74-3679(-)
MEIRRSKFDVSLVFCVNDEESFNTYHKNFHSISKTRVERSDVLKGEGCLVFPLPSAFGLYSQKSGLSSNLMNYLGVDNAASIRDHITRKYLGEQPVGSAFIINNQKKESKFRHILVVSVFRALTCEGDSMSGLDPRYIPPDAAYSAMRGIILALLRHNARSKNNKISSVYIPDMIRLWKEAPGGSEFTLSNYDRIVNQLALATKNMFEPPRVSKDWPDIVFLNSKLVKQVTIDGDFQSIFDSGLLESRGFFSIEELDQVIAWARDTRNKARQENSIRVLAISLQKSQSHTNISREQIASRVSSHRDGCLQILLESVVSHKIFVHHEIDERDITFGEIVGEGGEGTVYRGTYDGKHVAIKKFKSEVKIDDFIKELSIMSLVQHPNLVYCYGGVTKDGKKWIVSELMQTNLNIILNEPSISLDLGMITEIAVMASHGIDYLHSHCNLIHRDLRSMNLLINTHRTHLDVKVCDFGVSRIISKKEMTGNIGTVAWVAPEVFEGKKYSEKADIYSLGMILWELVTRQQPFADKSSFAIPISVIKGERPLIPKDCPGTLKRLIRSCWGNRSKQRPSAAKIIHVLTKFHKTLPSADKAQTTIALTNVIGFVKRNSSNITKIKASHSESGEKEKKRSEFQPSQTDSENSGNKNENNLKVSSTTEEDSNEANDNEDTGIAGEEETQTVTCVIPTKWSSSVTQYENIINEYFSQLKRKPSAGTILVNRDRYLLSWSKSFGNLLYEKIPSVFEMTPKMDQSKLFKALLHLIGYSVGRLEASDFVSKSSSNLDSTVAICASYMYSAYSGIGFVELDESSILVNKPHHLAIFTKNNHCIETSASKFDSSPSKGCFFSAGYLSGWATRAIGFACNTVETTCSIKGGSNLCQFTHAHPNFIKKLIQSSPTTSKRTPPHTPRTERIDTVDPTLIDYINVLNTVHLKSSYDEKSNLEDFGMDNKYSVESMQHKVEEIYIDPTTASVEIAEERFTLLRGSALSKGIFKVFLKDTLESDKSTSIKNAVKLMYGFGKLQGICHLNWMSHIISSTNGEKKKVEMDENLLSLLPHCLASIGWSTLQYKSDTKGLGNSFVIKATVTSSFEVSTWNPSGEMNKGQSKTKRKSKKVDVSEDSKDSNEKENAGICILHCGFISGWFESCLKHPIYTVETKCSCTGKYKNCEFLIGTAKGLKDYVHSNSLLPNTSSHVVSLIEDIIQK